MSEFETMDMVELKTYVISHRDNKIAWAKYIQRLIATDKKWYPAPIDEPGIEILQQVLTERFGTALEND